MLKSINHKELEFKYRPQIDYIEQNITNLERELKHLKETRRNLYNEYFKESFK